MDDEVITSSDALLALPTIYARTDDYSSNAAIKFRGELVLK
jgi:hypothetical protein